MVTEKNSDVQHDFFKDGICLKREGDWLKVSLILKAYLLLNIQCLASACFGHCLSCSLACLQSTCTTNSVACIVAIVTSIEHAMVCMNR